MNKIIIVLFLLISCISFSQKKIWFTEKLCYNLSSDFQLNLEYEDRYSDFNLDYSHADFGTTYEIVDNLKLNLNGRVKRTFENTEIIPHISLEYKFWNFCIKPKYEFVENRFRFKMVYTQNINENICLYTSDEIFSDFETNRFMSGVIFKHDKLSLTLSYLLLTTYGVGYDHIAVFGTYFRFN